MLSDLMKASARLAGEQLLDAESIALRLDIDAEEVRSWEDDPEYQDAKADALLSGAHDEAKSAFGGGSR